MIVSAFLSPCEIDQGRLRDSWVVVVDVLRATSTIVAALHNGAAGIQPVASASEAKERAKQLKNIPILLGGEKNGFRIEGFDLGNSPLEYLPERVKGRVIIFKTTNGTETFLRVKLATKILFGSFLNASAISQFLSERRPDHIFFTNSGLKGHFSLEDSVCSGYIISQLLEPTIENDGAAACLALARQFSSDTRKLLFEQSEHGRYLKKKGFEADLEYCSQKDHLNVIPVFNAAQNEIIRLDSDESL